MSKREHDEPTNGLTLCHVSCRFGARLAVDDVSFGVSSSEVLCILGPSGCGKSTTLRIAAGLERADSGRVYIGGQLVEGDDGERYCNVPPEKRGVGLMFQDYALFPHLSVRDNIAFGLKGLSRDECARRVAQEIEAIGLSHLADSFPHTLSGGEQQRVALARMLAPHPSVVLMDEPFSGLDSSLRESLRATTLQHLREAGAAVVIVTHDPDEAMRLGDRVVLMREGRIVQSGTPLEIYAQPADLQAAALVGGGNLFRAVAEDGVVKTPFGPIPVPDLADAGRVEVYYRAACIGVGSEGVRAQIRAIRPAQAGLEIEAEIEASDLPRGAEAPDLVLAMVQNDANLRVGDEIRLNADPKNALLFPCLDEPSRA